MAKAIVLRSTGGPEVMKLEQVPVSKPGSGEVLIKQNAIGVNFIDIYHRNGTYPVQLPATPGVEAAGIIEEVGEGVEGFKPGDRVAYATAPLGGYAERRLIHSSYLVHVPNEIPDRIAAASLVKGLTAHYLLFRAFAIRSGVTILVHAAAGGVGMMLCQWADYLNGLFGNITVIGTVSSEEKAAIAKANGCHYPIIYTQEDFQARVMEITNGEGVNVVYDSVGKDTFMKSLGCLMYFGMMISYGQSSGPVPPIDISVFAKKGLFFTRPSLFTYKQHRYELVLSANEVFDKLIKKALRPTIAGAYKLEAAAQAHKDIESRKTSGSVILLP